MPRLYCKPDSYVARRAPFAKHHIWTVPYDDEQRYPAGKHVPQTYETPADSVENWANKDRNIANTDIVSYITFGATHVPRPEDAPVIPAETIRMMFKPIGFFKQNPCLTIPSTQDMKSAAAKISEDSCCAKAQI